MKFKLIFILFNIVVVFSFLIVTLMPFFMLGGDYSLEFFKNSWYFFLIFLVVISLIDSYFFLNWKMFSLLESANWTDLILYLENRIYKKKNLYLYLVKILANTYLIKSDIQGLLRLEDFLRKEKPGLLKKIIISLSVPRFIDRDSNKMEAFFGEFVNEKGVSKILWVKFLYSFSLLLNNKRDQASLSLLNLCESKLPPLLKVLVIYSLNPFFELDKAKISCIDQKKRELRLKYQKGEMELELDRLNDNVLALVLNKFSKEAITWLYEEQ